MVTLIGFICLGLTSNSFALSSEALSDCQNDFRRDLGAKVTYSLVEMARQGRVSPSVVERALEFANKELDQIVSKERLALEKAARHARSCREVTERSAGILAEGAVEAVEGQLDR